MKQFELIKEYPDSPKLGTIAKENIRGFFSDNEKKQYTIHTMLNSEYWEEIKTPIILDINGSGIYKGDKYYTIFSTSSSYIEPYKIYGPHIMMGLSKICDSSWSTNCEFFKSKSDAVKWLENNKPKSYQILSFITINPNHKFQETNKVIFNKNTNCYDWDSIGGKDCSCQKENVFLNNKWKINSIKRLSDGEIFTLGDKTGFGIIEKIEIIKEEKIHLNFECQNGNHNDFLSMYKSKFHFLKQKMGLMCLKEIHILQ